MFSCLMIGGVGARTREVAIPEASCKLGGEGPAFGMSMVKSSFSAWLMWIQTSVNDDFNLLKPEMSDLLS